MIEILTKEQKDELFERLVTSASYIISDVLGVPRRTFAEIQAMCNKPTFFDGDEDIPEGIEPDLKQLFPEDI